MKWILSMAAAGAFVLAGCGGGVDDRLQDLADEIGCAEVEETDRLDMGELGSVAVCEELPNGQAGFLFSFPSPSERNEFFRGPWQETQYAGSVVLLHEDWAVAADARSLDLASELHEAVGGRPFR